MGVLRSSFLPDLTEGGIDAIVERHSNPVPGMAFTQLRVLGGAMGRVPAGATAFAHRDATVMASVITGTTEEHYGEALAWTEAYQAELSEGSRASTRTSSPTRARPACEGLPGRDVRAARPGQAPRRPGQLLPRQPQHPPELVPPIWLRTRTLAPPVALPPGAHPRLFGPTAANRPHPRDEPVSRQLHLPTTRFEGGGVMLVGRQPCPAPCPKARKTP